MHLASLHDGPWWGPDSVLDRDAHYQLVMRREDISRRCGLGPANMACLWLKLPDDVTPGERDWMRHVVRRHPVSNLVYTFTSTATVRARFHAMTGALVRSSVDARCLSFDTLVDLELGGGDTAATVLFIPDFFVADETLKKSERARQAVVSILRRRLASGGPFALTLSKGADKELRHAFGAALADEIIADFQGLSL